MWKLSVDGVEIGTAKSVKATRFNEQGRMPMPSRFGKTSLSAELTMLNARMAFTMTPVMEHNFKSVMLPIQTMNYASKKRSELPWRK